MFEGFRRLKRTMGQAFAGGTARNSTPTRPDMEGPKRGRSRAIMERRQSIEMQKHDIQAAEAARDAMARRGSPDEINEAHYSLLQKRRYLQELEADLVELEQPSQWESAGDPYDDPLEWDATGPNFESTANGLAIVVGHERRAPGATGRFEPDVAEYDWNTDLAAQIEAICKANGIRAGTFFRDNHGITGAYNQVRRFAPEAAVELHFNAADAKARGTETIYELRISEQWARVLQSEMLTVFAGPSRAAVLNKGDRRIKKASVENRGVQSLTQLKDVPSALIEPFFGDVFDECRLAAPGKPALARAIVNAYLKHTNRPALAPAAPAKAIESPAPVVPAPVTVVASDAVPRVLAASQLDLTPQFEQLRETYSRTAIEFPHLRAITYAQWALESEFGRSELARRHRNFAGMKWVPDMRKFAREVVYNPQHDPDGRTYCGFDDLDRFIAGFWHRLDLPSLPYATRDGGWRKHATTADQFIDFIGPIWAPRGGSNSRLNEGYEAKVRKRLAQLSAEGRLPSLAPVDGARPSIV
jgi:N-acetylmuramoyl-L-alanine amidase